MRYLAARVEHEESERGAMGVLLCGSVSPDLNGGRLGGEHASAHPGVAAFG